MEAHITLAKISILQQTPLDGNFICTIIFPQGHRNLKDIRGLFPVEENTIHLL